MNHFEHTLRDLARRHPQLREAAFDILVANEGLDFAQELETAPPAEALARQEALAYVASLGIRLLRATEDAVGTAARWMRDLLRTARPRLAPTYSVDVPLIAVEVRGQPGEHFAEFGRATWMPTGRLRLEFLLPNELAAVPGIDRALAVAVVGNESDRRGSDVAMRPQAVTRTAAGLALHYELPFLTNKLKPELLAVEDERVPPEAIAQVILFPFTGKIGG